jgi:GNAT superfamily N-acetyltransferase
MMAPELHHAETDGDIAACFAVLRQLRPSLEDAAELVGRVRGQQETGYHLLAAWDGARVVGAAGYRIQENLIRRRFVYVDDLVVLDEARRFGLGAYLLEEVARLGRDAGCVWLALDTGLGNALAQRFYFRQGLLATGLHFGMSLD